MRAVAIRCLLLLVTSPLLVAVQCAGSGLRPLTVAAYGDSLTAGGDWFDGLPTEWTMLDFGEPGDEWFDDIGLRALLGAAHDDADVAVLWGGTNDVRHPEWNLDVTVTWIRVAAQAHVAAGRPIVIVAPPPIFTPKGDPYLLPNLRLQQLRDQIFLLCDELGCPVADVWSAFWAHPNPASLYSDGIHPWIGGREIETSVLSVAICQAIDCRARP